MAIVSNDRLVDINLFIDERKEVAKIWNDILDLQ